MRAVPDAKGNGVGTEALVLEGQLLSIGALPGDGAVGQPVGGQPQPLGPLLADVQHVLVNVRHGDMAATLLGIGLVRQVAQVAEADVPGAAGHVQKAHPMRGTQSLHEHILPHAMDAQGHGIVHHVIGVGHLFEDLVH